MLERWETVEEFRNYSISCQGSIMNNLSGKILKPMISTSGYYYVHLVDNRRKHTRYVHRLVGLAFIPNPNNYPQIDHIDGNKLNNVFSNLRWVTISENYLAFGYSNRKEKRKRPVLAVHENGREIVFDSRLAAAEYFECSDTKIKYNYRYQKGNKKGWLLIPS